MICHFKTAIFGHHPLAFGYVCPHGVWPNLDTTPVEPENILLVQYVHYLNIVVLIMAFKGIECIFGIWAKMVTPLGVD